MTLRMDRAKIEVEAPPRLIAGLRRLVSPGGRAARAGAYRVRFVPDAAAGGVSFGVDAAARRVDVRFRSPVPDEALPEFLTGALAALTGPLGWCFLHSGAAARGGRAVVLVGNSRSGKTSLSLSLADRGFTLLSDETNVLRPVDGGFKVFAFPLRPQVRRGAFERLPEKAKRRARFTQTAGGKWILPSTPRAAGAPPVLAALVFLEYSPEETFRLERLDADALPAAFDRCTSGYLAPQPGYAGLLDYVLALRALCREGRVHRCVYSDAGMGRAADALSELAGPR